MVADFRNVCDYHVKNVARIQITNMIFFLSNSRWF